MDCSGMLTASCCQGDDEARTAEDEQFGAPRGAPGQWASCLRTVDPGSLQTTRRAKLAARQKNHLLLSKAATVRRDSRARVREKVCRHTRSASVLEASMYVCLPVIQIKISSCMRGSHVIVMSYIFANQHSRTACLSWRRMKRR